MTEQELLDAARRGDETAFGRLVEPHRAELHAHCYRMLGSVHDAEDALQEALLRAWRGAGPVRGPQLAAVVALHDRHQRLPEGDRAAAQARAPGRLRPGGRPARRPGRAARRVGLDRAVPGRAARPRRRLAGPEARYEQRESVELAFIAALQHLPARQRAVLILRDVLGFSGGEVADALDTTPASVYSALQRAHRTVDERLPEQSQQATLRALGDERPARDRRRATWRAWERGDVDAVVAMLAEDAVLAMPPMPTWYRRPRGGRRLPRAHAALGPSPLARDPCTLERPAGVRQLPVG